jgi:hypothetical protein
LAIVSHSYEEIRAVSIAALLARPSGVFNEHVEDVGRTLLQQQGAWPPTQTGAAYAGVAALLHPQDPDLILEVFWDLFRQGVVTLGHSIDIPGWPGYRLTRFGRQAELQAPYRFHDTASYVAMVKSFAPDLGADAEEYLAEAVASFYAECLLASTVMIGVAAEAEFLRLAEVAAKSATFGSRFSPVLGPPMIRQKIAKFQGAITPIVKSLPQGAVEDLDTHFAMIQSVLRVARNSAGHPTPNRPSREQAYVYLQLFAPFARQLMRLRDALA